MNSSQKYGLYLNNEKVFQHEDFGKPISERLSIILRRNTSKNDYANIALKSSVSFSTIRDVVYRTNSLTKSNAKAIVLLVHVAFENSIALKLQAESDTEVLNKMLKL